MNPAHICAAILDPRFSMKYFRTEKTVSVIRKFNVTPRSVQAVFERAAAKYNFHNQGPGAANGNRGGEEDGFCLQFVRGSGSGPRLRLQDEIEKYFLEVNFPTIRQPAGVLEAKPTFVSRRWRRWARHYLSIPATSVDFRKGFFQRHGGSPGGTEGLKL